MSNKKKGGFKIEIHPEDIKTRKRIAPGVRVIKSAKDKENKHRKDYLSLAEE
jgi:hypothetical protein